MNMKPISLIFILLLLFSCKKEGGLTTFGLNYNTEFVIPSSIPVGSPVPLFTPAVETRHEQEFSQNNTRADLVRELKINHINLTITHPPNQTFRFLQSVQLYLTAEGLPEVLVAKKMEIPSNIGSELQLDIEDVDLAEYIKKDRFTLKARTVTREILTRDVTIEADLDFRVRATLLSM